MDTQQRIIRFVQIGNWALLCVIGAAALVFASQRFASGVIAGGMIVTVNFHLLSRTLRKALQPRHVPSLASLLAKYYLRFFASAVIIFILIYWDIVEPLGLLIGLSVVVASIILATLVELKHLLLDGNG